MTTITDLPAKATIHLGVESAKGPIQSRQAGGSLKRFEVACRPTARKPKHMTDHWFAVTCEACKATEAFKTTRVEQGEMIRHTGPNSAPDVMEDADPDEFGKDEEVDQSE